MLLLRVETIIKILVQTHDTRELMNNITVQYYLKNTLFNYMEELICQ